MMIVTVLMVTGLVVVGLICVRRARGVAQILWRHAPVPISRVGHSSLLVARRRALGLPEAGRAGPMRAIIGKRQALRELRALRCRRR
jgi:hypothetical protein